MNFRQFYIQIIKKISYYFQILDYSYFLPASTYLPVSLGLALARIRGLFNVVFDLDWRSLSTGVRFVRKGTWKVMCYLRPEGNTFLCLYKTVSRFIVMSREEWEACFFIRHSMQKVMDESTVKGFDAVLAAQQKGRGVILLTPHFDSYCTGVVLMGMKGLRLNAMTTNVIRDPMVNPAIGTYFANKFDAMERFFNGGKIVAKEESKRFFYQVLSDGESLVMGADLPATGKTASNIYFLGENRKMSPGPLRLAQKTNSLLTGFVCLYEAPGQYLLEFAPLYDATDGGLKQVYKFLEQHIRRKPQNWWASDLFAQYVE